MWQGRYGRVYHVIQPVIDSELFRVEYLDWIRQTFGVLITVIEDGFCNGMRFVAVVLV